MNYAPILLVSAISTLAIASSPDPLAPRPNGMQPAAPSRHLITDATIHTAPGQTLEHADILIDQGHIISIGTNLSDPAATTWHIDNAHIYAGFIDPYIEVDAPMPPEYSIGQHWSNKVTPQRDALDEGLDEDTAKSLREMGFTAAMIAPDSGIFRGWSAIVSTAQSFPDPSMGTPPTYQAHAGMMMGFDRNSWPNNDYPNSHMGVVALMRQTFIDAQHRAITTHTDENCLDQIHPDDTTYYYETNQELEAILADKVASEFDHPNIVIIDNGTAHRRLDAFKEMNHPVIVPLRYPETPDVFSVGAADSVDLATLQHFERAPANARWLLNSGLDVALTTSKLRDGEDFWTNLHTAIEKGLPQADALALLTTNPAKIIGLEDQGTIAKDHIANLVIADGNLFDPDADARIIDTWIDGRRHHINDQTNTRFDGSWTIDLVDIPFQLTMNIEGDSITISTKDGDDDGNGNQSPTENKARKVNIDHNQISFVTDDPNNDTTVITGTLSPDGIIRGSGLSPDQQPFQWTATKNAPTVEEADEHTEEVAGDDTDSEPDLLPDLPTTPFGPYAYDSKPEQLRYLLTNATVWTQSGDGVLENASVVIADGKIYRVLKGGYGDFDYDLDGIALQTIDVQGMHITPGIIDAHSHTGLFRFGVNESGQAVTAECRIADSLDPGFIGFYRELAGGVTTAQLLHGSANPMGGQSQTVKLRWNSAKPQDMFFEGAKPGIKFALGENVKQSNWGDKNTTRYPQTRMGVETLMRDRFAKAREYAANRGKYEEAIHQANAFAEEINESMRSSLVEHKSNGMKITTNYSVKVDTPDLVPSRDLELETLAQILAGERLVHCHSYRQDEILMLCRIAEDFGFKIGTFQHGLETYKVAEIVKEHAIGTSIFSDWWAYKVEVTDAIPFAGPINHEVGLLTSYNSDSDDLARRMNVEAGKALKYAKLSGIDMTEQEALAFVTTNPAIQLGIIDRVGTLEQGKDADLVVWTANPLSSLSRPEMTFVDGRLMFSREMDQHLREKNAAERQRIIQKILAKGKPDQVEEIEDDSESEHDLIDDPDFHTCNQRFPSYNTDY
ncbi:MAG: amidohydrolase family protein [Phycisphaerales bacterium]